MPQDLAETAPRGRTGRSQAHGGEPARLVNASGRLVRRHRNSGTESVGMWTQQSPGLWGYHLPGQGHLAGYITLHPALAPGGAAWDAHAASETGGTDRMIQVGVPFAEAQRAIEHVAHARAPL
jgi:hypothetical protein